MTCAGLVTLLSYVAVMWGKQERKPAVEKTLVPDAEMETTQSSERDGLEQRMCSGRRRGEAWMLPQWPRWPWGRILRMPSQGGQRKEGIPWRRRSIRQRLNGHEETSETSRWFGYSKLTELPFDASFWGWSPNKQTKTVEVLLISNFGFGIWLNLRTLSVLNASVSNPSRPKNSASGVFLVNFEL